MPPPLPSACTLAAAALPARLRLPVIGSPMFLVSNPALVIAQCCAGVVGAFPALNARPQEQLDTWLVQIEAGLQAHRQAHPDTVVAPYAVNLIVHASNARLQDDLASCVRQRVPIVITSLQAPDQVVEAVHGYGGIVLHDVTTLRHAKKAIGAGVDGLILVCAGAGGHAGALSPFALAGEIRPIFDGLLVLAGAISRGEGILAAQALGCDLVYMGTRFLATEESAAPPAHKQMIVDGAAVDFGKPKRWKDIWGAGQGIGSIDAVWPAARVVDQLEREYRVARQRLGLV